MNTNKIIIKKVSSILLVIIMIFSIVPRLNITASADELLNIQVKGICDYTKANEVLKIVNEERSKNGLGSLSMDTELLNSAMYRATETAIYWSHTRPDGSSCFTICNKMSGENIAVNQETPKSVMNAWMNSPGHRANILNPYFESIGIGCFETDFGYYWVQCFSDVPAENIPNYSGTVGKTNTVSIQKSFVELYASIVKNTANSNYMKVKKTGYFNYGIINQTWSWAYCPGVASDYIFSSSNTSVISIDSNGKFTAVGAGTATVSISLKADLSKSYSEKITVLPSKVTKLTVKAKDKKLKITWKKVKEAKGYEVQVSKNKKFKKKKIIFDKFTKKKKLTIKSSKIKSNKKYYIRVRSYATYKNENGKTQRIYGEWKEKTTKGKIKSKQTTINQTFQNLIYRLLS